MEVPIAKLVYRKRIIAITDLIHPFIQTLADYIVPANPEAMNELQKILEILKK